MKPDWCRSIVEQSSFGFAYVQVLADTEGNPLDFTYLEANPAYGEMLGLQPGSVAGRSARAVHPDSVQDGFNWLASIGRVGVTGRTQRFTQRLGPSGNWFHVTAICPQPDFVLIQLAEVSLEFKRLQLFEGIFNLTPVILCVIETSGKFVMVNDEWTHVLGYERNALLSASFQDFLHPADIKPTTELVANLSENQVVYNYVNRYRHADGSYRHLEWRAQISGDLVYGTARDITERLVVEKQKQRELDLMNLLFEQTLTGMAVMMLDAPVDWDAAGDKDATIDRIMREQRVVRTNNAFLTQYKATAEEMIGRRAIDFFRQDPEAGKAAWKLLLDGKRLSLETEERRFDGSVLWVRGDYTCLHDSKGRFVGHFGMQLDITDRKLGEVALEKSERMYRLITEYASDVIWVFDVSHRTFTYISPSVERFIGYAPEELLNQPFTNLLHPDDGAEVHDKLRKMVAEFKSQPERDTPWTFQVRHLHRNGSIVWSDATVNFRYTEADTIEGIGVSRDITVRRENEEKILHLSYHDQLTGLYNRRFYEERVRQLSHDRLAYPLSMVVCDVNGLKLTNDVFGHHTGDRLLQLCAEVLSSSVRGNQFVSRIGGDEFVLLMGNTDADAAESAVMQIREAVQRQRVGKTHLSVSFGIATATEPRSSLEPLFKEAEDAMYRQKLLESSSYKHDVIKILIGSLYEKGQYERQHSDVVAQLCYHIGKEMALHSSELDELRLAGMLHDIGKIGIDSDVLNRKGPLNDHEWEQMRRHPEMGFQILRSVQNFGRIADWILMHHEQPDGNGYPQNLTDAQIPLASKIIAVANAYDSMTSSSGYREAKDHAGACAELVRCSGSQFDRAVVEALLRLPVQRILQEIEHKEVWFDGRTRHG